MPERYEQAWDIPWSPEIGGVLVRCGSGRSVWWWVLCPSAATLYIGAVEGGKDACSNGPECGYPEIHEAAVEVWKAVRDPEPSASGPADAPSEADKVYADAHADDMARAQAALDSANAREAETQRRREAELGGRGEGVG